MSVCSLLLTEAVPSFTLQSPLDPAIYPLTVKRFTFTRFL
ncbi:hypothetical protein L580_1363 [Serratia fonticola AU-P3(3)]|nr:hypothetical protein L580_1363 [Serratia fonticola AU-P3(3)]ERK10080.1 hypothetical protein L581_4478 [Serratia fonticola AU-AP2C]